MRTIIAFIFLSVVAVVAAPPPNPLFNTKLTTSMNGNGFGITNLGTLRVSNVVDAATGSPWSGGGGGDIFWLTNSSDGGIDLLGDATKLHIDLDGSMGNANFRLDGTSGAFLGGPGTFGGAVSVNSQITLSSDGSASFASGNVSIGSDASASFAGNVTCSQDLTCHGKFTADGTVDPASVLFDKKAQAEFLQIYANEVLTDKQSGLALWFNGTNLMAYQGSTKIMFLIPSMPVGVVDLPKAQPRKSPKVPAKKK